MTPDHDIQAVLTRHALGYFDEVALGAVRCAFSTAPEVTVRRLLATGATRPEGERVAVLTVDLAKPVFELAGEFVRGLASVALAVWPDWYGRPDLFATHGEHSWQATFDRLDAARAASKHRSVLRGWLEPAIGLCRADEIPVTPGFTPTTHLQQLALAIASDALMLAVEAKANGVPDAASLMGLARNLEWLAQHSGARVVAVLPVAWSGRAELEGVSWGCWRVEEDETPLPTTGRKDEPRFVVSPIRGRPHPGSPGEQKLAERLARDPHLGPLFVFNELVHTTKGSRFRVDAAWIAGKIVVEIDGFGWHTSREAFASDRHRDYELQLSGYLVLRMPHDAVVDDVELAIDKIHDFVKLRAERGTLEGSK